MKALVLSNVVIVLSMKVRNSALENPVFDVSDQAPRLLNFYMANLAEHEIK